MATTVAPILPQRRKNPLLDDDGRPDYTFLIEPEPEPQPAEPGPGLLERIGGALSAARQAAAPVLEQIGRTQYEVQSEQLRAQAEGLVGLAETGTGVVTGMAGFGAGAGQFIGRAVVDIGRTKAPDYWKRLYELSHEIAGSMTYQPRTEAGQLGMQAVGAAMHPVMEFSRIAADAPLVRMLATDDEKYAVRFAHELITMAAIDPVLRASLGSMRSKTSRFRNEFAKAHEVQPTSAPELVRTADEIVAEASKPELAAEINAAKERLTKQAERPEPVTPDTSVEQLRDLVTELTDAANTLPEGTPESIRAEVNAQLAKARQELQGVEAPEVAPAVEPPPPTRPRRVRAKKPVEEPAEVAQPSEAPTPRYRQTIKPGDYVVDEGLDVTPAIAKPKRAPRKKIKQEEPAPVIEPETPAAAAQPKYRRVNTLQELRDDIARIDDTGDVSIVGGAIQVRTSGGRPVAVLFDDSGLNALSSISEIRRQTERGQIQPDVATTLEQMLARQAELAGVPLEQAHQYGGEWLRGEVERIARELDVELYRARRTKEGIEYDQVPREAVEAANKLERSSPLEPSDLTSAEAGALVEERTRPIGDALLGQIKQALEEGQDISHRLPGEMQEIFREMLAQQREGLDTSEVRTFMSVLKDMLDVIAPPDTPPTQLGMLSIYGMTPRRKAAALRLYADARKANRSFDDMLRESGLSMTERVLMNRYISSLGARVPVPPIEPREHMVLDSRAVAAGDVIVKQRKLAGNRQAVPVYASEAAAVQQSRPIHRRIIERFHAEKFGNPYYVLRQARVPDIMYAYRAAQTAADLWKRELNRDLTKLTKGMNIPSRERVGDYAIGQQPKGAALVQAAGRQVPTTLNANELSFYEASRTLFDYLHGAINDVRRATGRSEFPKLDDYWPMVRAFNVAQELGLSPSLTLDSPKKIAAHITNLAHVPFKHEKARTKAIYSPKNDAFELLQNYVHSAIDQLTLAPFLEKLNELVNHPMPVAGQNKQWNMRTANPNLYTYLNDWRNYLVTGSNKLFSNDPATNRFITRGLQFASRSLGLSLLAGKTRTALVQFSTIANTIDQLGPVHTMQGIASLAHDGVFHGFKNHFEHLQHSNVLRTRSVQTALDEATTAIVGGNVADFTRLMARGEITKLQGAAANAGFAFMKFNDTISAHAAWESAYQMALKKITNDKRMAGRIADDVTVMTQGGTMPGDVAGIQRNALGKLGTQFQRFLIGEWNYVLNEVLGGERYMQRLVRETAGKPAQNKYYGLAKGVVTFVALQEAMNAAFEIGGMQGPFPSPVVGTLRRATKEDSDMLSGVGVLAAELSEYVPVLGPTKYGRGIAGPAVDTVREAYATMRGEPLAYKLRKKDDTVTDTFVRLMGSPIARLLGFPFAGAIGTFKRGQDRGEGVWGSLVGTYNEPQKERGVFADINRQTGAGIHRKIH